MTTPSRSVALNLLTAVFAVAGAAACHSAAETGVTCRDGSFYFDGAQFTDCKQCSDPADCMFSRSQHCSCTYPGGVKTCTCTTLSRRACCAGQCAVLDANNACSENVQLDLGSPSLDGPLAQFDRAVQRDMARTDRSASDGATSLSGTWKGTWSAGGFSGALTLVITQAGSTLTGTATFGGSPCFTTGAVSATATGSSAKGTITTASVTITFTVAAASTKLTGTFDVSGGLCNGTAGTVTLSR